MSGVYETELSLFPLTTVLFPEGPLPLRIFEPRYLNMVSECLRDERPFVVSLITDGAEVGAPAETHDVGTLARIVDWDRAEDGLLTIVAAGEERVRVTERRVSELGLVRCRVEPGPSEEHCTLPYHYRPLAELLRRLLEETEEFYAGLPRRFDDASWVGFRMAEVLPLGADTRQRLLELDDPVARLARVEAAVNALRDRGE